MVHTGALMLEVKMDLNPKLDPNVVLNSRDIDAVALHFPDCDLFSDDCNFQSQYNDGGKITMFPMLRSQTIFFVDLFCLQINSCGFSSPNLFYRCPEIGMVCAGQFYDSF